MYNGQAVTLKSIENGLVELVLNAQGAPVNTLNSLAMRELGEAVEIIAADSSIKGSAIKGLLISSAKPAFIVGADITEFMSMFGLPDAELEQRLAESHALFSRIESLPFPTLTAVNGMALGGGFELALSTDFRVLTKDARVGLPEVNLGIYPGWGGTVRLSRMIDTASAMQWMLTGKPQKAAVALELGVADRLAEEGELRTVALELLQAAVNGEVDFHANRQRKQQPIQNSAEVKAMAAEMAKKLDPNYPAPIQILEIVATHASLPFDEALKVETEGFTTLAKSDAAKSLIGLFLNDQLLKKKARNWSKQAAPVKQSAVLGAGIMGGGVAYQSASTGTPILMKDIRDEALELGISTASGLLDKQIEKGRLTEEAKQAVLGGIQPTLSYDDFSNVDIVVEAVVENPAIKASVLAEVEKAVPATAVLASNTSTISINQLAESVSRPEQFCGMHFFNPVHLMPLVEVIRGSQTSDETIARTVAYASAMGKTPIVVNDCPGFLVNRILFPYFNAFNRLLLDGVDFERIDRVMEGFGWPMGPAYLADVVGIDTLVHADHVMQEGFPVRMGHDGDVIAAALLDAKHLGQKNGKGFYEYGKDENGRRFKKASEKAQQLIEDRRSAQLELTDQQIIDRMMIPMCLEAALCLEDGIVETPAEADMGLILGLGFPRFRGGALRYIDTLGLEEFARRAEEHQSRGALYQLTEGFKARLAEGRSYY
ncbi:fatty acid oxidation complex subunit alpha FadB [Marinobacterium mangrovicola]|uniref:enoyl-CoA hydratase n=1 Tax=Marinobacterium mangrovicola TaxID=1476959 RepID=A0A4R1GKZ1_9GAMM|nr:fatty acid oxidation complex subunit alpha FadB [Marinobacterium mangrovicola]TCK09074.1 3-hydroxyacyl-CoA dehydrogenase/enoyl-CoA hydratase/3-hydroxybutyryl-CoA epimerase/enoyl-CoA isomerase [Marinobacterium mangrovicola]